MKTSNKLEMINECKLDFKHCISDFFYIHSNNNNNKLAERDMMKPFY